MENKDYYQILGVSKDATSDQIKKKYRKLASKYHPDVSKDKDAEHKFKEVGEAYEVLKDPEKRKAYDQYGENWETAKEQEQYQQQYHQNHDFGGFSQGGFDFGGSGDFNDIFENLFGGRANAHSQRRSHKGEDINASITIPLSDAYKSSTRQITFQSSFVDNKGRISNRPTTLNVKIPTGLHNGKKIRLKGKGEPGYNGGDSGDLYLKVNYQETENYHVEDGDVYMSFPIAPWEAALGESVSISIPDGSNIKLKIPNGTQSGKKLRLKGKGIPSQTPGDLYVILKVIIPSADDDKVKKVYEDMKSLDFNPRENYKAF
ncbi:DnaJ C-terminal domain-containing protein [Sediminitomix flava]|uniref:Curved DNA-binding protein n=1 Tax=Sediminitomix flava TaxID=379075 RepID=A0A315Z6F7_SEDFL|nr:J domain-containing protein [Sediminitomix flava]PWJ38560.1 curved DNA-binding protein [Sediminitomix flava]